MVIHQFISTSDDEAAGKSFKGVVGIIPRELEMTFRLNHQASQTKLFSSPQLWNCRQSTTPI